MPSALRIPRIRMSQIVSATVSLRGGGGVGRRTYGQCLDIWVRIYQIFKPLFLEKHLDKKHRNDHQITQTIEVKCLLG